MSQPFQVAHVFGPDNRLSLQQDTNRSFKHDAIADQGQSQDSPLRVAETLCSLFTTGLSSSMPRTKRTKGMAQCDPDSMGDTGVPSSSHEQTALTLQRTKWTTAGQGGTIMQLERVGDILAQPQQMPRQYLLMYAKQTRTMENHTEDLAVEMNLDSGPLPEFQMAESGSRFGFQAQTPRQPSFVGMQSLNKYEQD
ncbi:hypothetical protein BKA83DRAFT_4127659 [Pisolithus microcarpus]|nr:hypothetical protein BKA83DRAFT_4127659 [Pisolithus microcarpus]